LVFLKHFQVEVFCVVTQL